MLSMGEAEEKQGYAGRGKKGKLGKSPSKTPSTPIKFVSKEEQEDFARAETRPHPKRVLDVEVEPGSKRMRVQHNYAALSGKKGFAGAKVTVPAFVKV